jgi:hypothetical protein
MKHDWRSLCQLAVVLLVGVAWEPGTLKAVAQSATPLTERSDYIGGCRLTSAVGLNVFEDARLTRAIGSVPANTQVTLTGVLGSGTAQIKAPLIGWVQAANLRSCATAGTPAPPPDRLSKGACRRLRSPEFDGAQYADLKNGLVAYNQPGSEPQRAGTVADGPGQGATVYFVEPRQVEGKWVRVFYVGLAGNERIGWVSLGTGDRVNFADCFPATPRPPNSPTSPLP